MKNHPVRTGAGFRRALLLALSVSLLQGGCFTNREAFYFGSYSEAEKLYNKKQYEKAIQKYQAYIDENPEGNLATISEYYIARSHDALNHQAEARQLYQQIVEKHAGTPWAHFAETRLKEMGPAPAQDPTAASQVEVPPPEPKTEDSAKSPRKRKWYFLYLI